MLSFHSDFSFKTGTGHSLLMAVGIHVCCPVFSRHNAGCPHKIHPRLEINCLLLLVCSGAFSTGLLAGDKPYAALWVSPAVAEDCHEVMWMLFPISSSVGLHVNGCVLVETCSVMLRRWRTLVSLCINQLPVWLPVQEASLLYNIQPAHKRYTRCLGACKSPARRRPLACAVL